MGNVFKNKWFWIVVVVLGIILFIYFSGRAAGRKFVPKDVIIPSDTQPIGSTGNFNPGPYTDAVYNDINTFLPHSTAPYDDLIKLSNSQLVAVYNDWSQRYYSKSNETMVQALKGESSLFNVAWVYGVDAVLKRFASLNLT